MTKVVAEHIFNGPTQMYTDTYNSKNTILGKWMRQSSDGYAAPMQTAALRFLEAGNISPGFDGWHPFAIDVGNNTHWVFFAENTTTNNVQRYMLSVHNTLTNEWLVKGWLTCNWATAASTQTQRAFAVFRYTHTTGSVYAGTNSTSLSGISTDWATAGIAAGARIGFGSTNPANIKVWYEISSIGSDTSITLTSATLNAIPKHTDYVIEELRIYSGRGTGTTISGLHIAKGLNYNDFRPDGSITISTATTTDNLKRCYWAATASTELNTFVNSLCLSDTWSNSTQYCYLTDGLTTSMRIYKHNVRATLSNLSSGKQGTPFSSYLFRTGTITTLSQGGPSDKNVGTLATALHGPCAGEEAIYTALGTSCASVAIPTKYIVDSSTSYLTNYFVGTNMPGGGATAFASPNVPAGFDYSPSLDRFIITHSAGGAFVYKFSTDGRPFEHRFLTDPKNIDKRTTANYFPPMPIHKSGGEGLTIHLLNGYLYTNKYFTAATTATTSNSIAHVYAVGNDWDQPATAHRNQNKLITPEIFTPNCQKFGCVGVSYTSMIGEKDQGMLTNACRIYYRTAGISDDSGTWNLVPSNGNMTGVGSAPSIQFMFDFKGITTHTAYPRIYAVNVSYETEGTDSHFQPSTNFSNKSTKIFVWKFATAFGTSVPTLNVKIYESVTNILLIKDTTLTGVYGTFQKSTDGGFTWSSYNSSDKANERTYIRYVPSALADDLKVKVVLTR